MKSTDAHIAATRQFLKVLRVPVSGATLKDAVLNHPQYPSLLAISDALSKWNIPNAAARIDKDHLERIPTPFLALTDHPRRPLAVITDITESRVSMRHREYSKTDVVSKESFLRDWSGIYLLAEPQPGAGEINYTKNKIVEFFQGLVPVVLIAAFLYFPLVLFLKNALLSTHVTARITMYISQLAGAVTSGLLIWFEKDRNNPFLQKVCTGFTNGNCESVLTSGGAKLLKTVSWSEIGFVFFAGNIFNLSFNYSEDTVLLTSMLSAITLPYIGYSLYYQWQVVKQWCILCLIVQAVILISGTAGLALRDTYPLSFAILNGSTAVAFIFPAIGLVALQPVAVKLQRYKIIIRKYNRLQSNSDVFQTLLQKQRKVIGSTEDLGIVLGNPEAKNTLIKVCNPYCTPCAESFRKTAALLLSGCDVNVRIIFGTPNNPLNPGFKPVAHFLAIAEQHSEKIFDLLNDWYKSDRKDPNVVLNNYPVDIDYYQKGIAIQIMDDWCEKNKIKFTPTNFLNGMELPSNYSIEDLKNFL